MKTECQASEPDYIETWTPYPVGKPERDRRSSATFAWPRTVSQSRIDDVLSGRNPPYTLGEVVAAKATLENKMREKGMQIPP